MTERATEQGSVPEHPDASAAIAAALLGEAMTKSGLLWIEVDGDRTWPAWHVGGRRGRPSSSADRASSPSPGSPRRSGSSCAARTRRAPAHRARPRARPRARHARVAARHRAAPRLAAQLGRRLADPVAAGAPSPRWCPSATHSSRRRRMPPTTTASRPPAPPRRRRRGARGTGVVAARRRPIASAPAPRPRPPDAPRRSGPSCARSASDVAPVGVDVDPIALSHECEHPRLRRAPARTERLSTRSVTRSGASATSW